MIDVKKAEEKIPQICHDIDYTNDKYKILFLFQYLCSLVYIVNEVAGVDYTRLIADRYYFMKDINKMEMESNKKTLKLYNNNLHLLDNTSKMIINRIDKPLNVKLLKSDLDRKETDILLKGFLDSINPDYRKYIVELNKTNMGCFNNDKRGFTITSFRDLKPYVVLDRPIKTYDDLYIFVHELGHVYENFLLDSTNYKTVTQNMFKPFSELSSSYFERMFIEFLRSEDNKLSELYNEKCDWRLRTYLERLHLAIASNNKMDSSLGIYISNKDIDLIAKIDNIDYKTQKCIVQIDNCINYGFGNLFANYLKEMSIKNASNYIMKNRIERDFRKVLKESTKILIKK